MELWLGAAIAAYRGTGASAEAATSKTWMDRSASRVLSARRHNALVGEPHLQQGSMEVSKVDSSGLTLLHRAAERGQSQAVALLLAAGAPVDARTLGAAKTPLMLAAGSGHVAVVQQLLGAGAAVNAVDARGASSLLLAAGSDSSAALQVLLAEGADPNVVDASGRTPLSAAAAATPPTQIAGNCADSLQQLLDAGGCPAVALKALCAGKVDKVALPMVASLAAHFPLSASEWELVPADCPSLGAALPAVAARCEREAVCLVRKLPAATRQLLRVAALSLARAQHQLEADLPCHVVSIVLALCAA